MKTFQAAQRVSSRGMSLVELLVAMTLGLFLILMVVSVYVTTASSSRANVLSAQMNEDAALAIELLQEQIRLSGFSGLTNASARNFNGVPLRGCDGGFTAATDNGLFSQLGCRGGNGPDALAIRYEATLLNSQRNDTAVPDRPANCTSNAIAPAIQGTGASISLADNRFYIANDGVNAGRPTLFCRGSNGAGGFSDAAALIPNIEDLQLRYALTRAPTAGSLMPHQITAHANASDASLGNVEANWSRVAAVHICLVARSAQPVAPGDNQTTDIGRFVDCNDTVQQPVDRFIRRSYRSTIFLRNTRPAVPGAFSMDGNIALNPYRHLNSAN